MPHPLVRRGGGPPKNETGDYVAQVYVNRQKVWEESFGSEDEAWQHGRAENQKHHSENSIVVVRKRKP